MFHPEHVKDGEILVRAIPVTDLRQDGFSLHRMAHVSQRFVELAVQERLMRPRKTPWRDEGVAVLYANEVRGLRLEADQAQALVIIDTAKVGHRGHASLFVADPDRGPAHARKLRALLLPPLAPANEHRSGIRQLRRQALASSSTNATVGCPPRRPSLHGHGAPDQGRSGAPPVSAACTRRRGSAQRCPDARREACDADATAVGLYAIGRVEAVGALVVVGDASGAVCIQRAACVPADA